jgi:serine/threonine protein kinase
VQLESEDVVRVMDVGKLDDGAPFIVMEHLEGEDLAHMLARRGPLPVHEVIACILQACDALSEAHGKGIIHRDIKPANLFVAARANKPPIVKVLDFGIAKAKNEALALTTVAGPDLFFLFAEANRIRERFLGSGIFLCSIINAKSGRCPENCSFCAQSAHHITDAPVYPLVDEERMVACAREAESAGSSCYGIITSGTARKTRSPIASRMRPPRATTAAPASASRDGATLNDAGSACPAALIAAAQDSAGWANTRTRSTRSAIWISLPARIPRSCIWLSEYEIRIDWPSPGQDNSARQKVPR